MGLAPISPHSFWQSSAARQSIPRTCQRVGDIRQRHAGDERDRVGGDPVPVALESYQVVVVELACLQPLD
jgi:hypothetical protein